MFKIIEKERVAPGINKFVIEAPLIAQKRQPGQFVILRLHEKGERVPMTIADADPKEGTITIFAQEVGKTTMELGTYKAGDYIKDVVGPLGKPTPIHPVGTVFCIGGGVGTAEVLPIAKRHKEVGNKVCAIIGARTKELIILEEEFKKFADELYITTDDGSYGRKGFVTDELKYQIENGKRIDEVIAVGPAIMMKAVCELTKPHNIKTLVSLNAIMVDATGMCGACRVEVGGKTKYACVDGPEFDGHQVNFDLLLKRLDTFKKEEKIAVEKFLKERGKNG